MDNQNITRDSGCLYIPFVFPGVSSVGCAFSTVHAGNVSMSADPKDARQAPANRKRLLDALGLARWAELKQVHGDALVIPARETPLPQSSELEADGHATREKGLALVIKTADCQPLFFAAEDGSAIAALHVGWRGNAINYPASGLKAFCTAYGLEPSRVLAVRGPSLGPAAAEFVNFSKEWAPRFSAWYDARRRTMDLWRLTVDQLVGAGMRADRIFGLDLCTCSLPELFFSFRLGHSGRQASLIWIKE